MKIGYFPGCSLKGTAIEYEASLFAVCKEFDIELEEIKEWNCCGATAAHSLNHLLSIALPARTLALAEMQGFTEILVPCAACYSRLLSAWHEIKTDEALRTQIPGIIELPFNNTVKPVNIIDFIEKYISPGLKEKVVRPFNNKVACYYGCLLVRPPKLVQVDRFEDPLQMEQIMKILGSSPIDWAFKTECCGAGLSVSRTDIVAKLSGKIVKDATDRGAEAIVVACPMCQSNLDMRRSSIDVYLKQKMTTPVLYITQVIGLSLGMSPRNLGIEKHIVPMDELLLNKAVVVEKNVKVKPVKEDV